ncbi:UNVERIFIED_CONTAM: hypothetical protein PYX00_010913 [Menopon gallinae]|uniref:Phospholipid/glycerol acyltransferase domain-containing protein n=1 Tax=Menopon gallinae TaxID=328185 RepID=A0AAW2H6P7_9NEOP
MDQENLSLKSYFSLNKDKFSSLGIFKGERGLVDPKQVFIQSDPLAQKLSHSFVDALMSPDSTIEGLEYLKELSLKAEQGASCLILLEHYSNADYPCFHQLLYRMQAQDVANKMVAIAGVKLYEKSDLTHFMIKAYTSLLVYPSRSIIHLGEGEKALAEKERASAINMAFLRQLRQIKNKDRLIVLFPSGTRYREGKPETKELVSEVATYLKQFDYCVFIGINGNVLRIVSENMDEDILCPDTLVFTVSQVYSTHDFIQDCLSDLADADMVRQKDWLLRRVSQELFKMHERDRMPSKENIERFKQVLKNVAKEPEILASRGLKPQEVSAPDLGEPILPWSEEDSEYIEPLKGSLAQQAYQNEMQGSSLQKKTENSPFDELSFSDIGDEASDKVTLFEGQAPSDDLEELISNQNAELESDLSSFEKEGPASFEANTQESKKVIEEGSLNLDLDGFLDHETSSEEFDSDYFDFEPPSGQGEEGQGLLNTSGQLSTKGQDSPSFEPMDDLFSFEDEAQETEPWQATNYFKAGLEAIQEGQSEKANEFFQKAYHIRRWDEWFIRYALTYEAQRNYEQAVKKYEEMLTIEPFAFGANSRRRTKYNHDGYLAYSQLRTRQGLYQEADNLLQAIISENVRDYEAWLARGDNNMAWADLNPNRYVDALKSYASVIEMHGDSPEVLFKLLNYYIKTDDETEAYRLYQYIEKKNYKNIDAVVYTDYAAYLLLKDAQLAEYMERKEKIFRIGKYSQGQQALLDQEYSHILNKNVFYLSDIGHILSRSTQSDPTYPLTYYYLARYFKRSQNEILSRQAIEEALKYFYLKKSLNPSENYINILSFKEMGRLLEDSQEYLSARQFYQKGIELYENLLDLEVLKPAPELSELFALQGYSFYRFYEDSQAQLFFEKAIKEGFSDVDLKYSLANIYYLQKEYEKAIAYLFEIESTPSYRVDTNLLYTMATSLVANKDQQSAIGYYLQLLSILDERRTVLTQVELHNPIHLHLLEESIKTLNNLGVAELTLAKDLKYREYFNEGVRHLSLAEELFDLSKRGERKEKILEKDLAALNLAEVWKPEAQLLLYQGIPRYLEAQDEF